MARLAFDWREVDIDELVIAGWTARDVAALNHHIEELKAIGVPPPSRVPLYYRLAACLLTQAENIQVLGAETSGEVEPVLLGTPDRLWVTVGADHTDRKMETYGVAVAKQLCPKVLARTAWRFEEVEPHWDQLVLKSFIHESGGKVLYQDGTLATLRPPRELIAGWRGNARLPPRVAMFCGTVPAIGGVRASRRFEMELHDPVLGRTLTHAYDIHALPVVA
ncbi:MAG: DUF2848 domain-containing protein [Alphaproteobacteria bacterium]|nr:DUF2848 domain-containing protein [Alphaproteobacteria bacterium]